jgi:hypothetical protein
MAESVRIHVDLIALFIVISPHSSVRRGFAAMYAAAGAIRHSRIFYRIFEEISSFFPGFNINVIMGDGGKALKNKAFKPTKKYFCVI